ncbi:MAG: hypothetical protein LBD66_00290 [Holosporales bacterium]|nr:hypothetical protein [Holosporales bacterium]
MNPLPWKKFPLQSFTQMSGGRNPLFEEEKDFEKNEGEQESPEELFEKGRLIGREEAQRKNRHRKEDQIRALLAELRTALDHQEHYRQQYERQTAQEYITLLKEALIQLFPLLEERLGTFETASFLKKFFKKMPEDIGEVHVTLPEKELENLKKYFAQSREKLDPRFIWTVTEEGASEAIQISWEEGGVIYARKKLFTEMLHVLADYAAKESQESPKRQKRRQ